MKIKVDRDNRVVIAKGGFEGKKIVAVAVCHNDDAFDEEFGIQLATKKYNIKKRQAKLRKYEKIISAYNELIDWAIKQRDMYEDFADAVEKKIAADAYDCEKFVNDYYNK